MKELIDETTPWKWEKWDAATHCGIRCKNNKDIITEVLIQENEGELLITIDSQIMNTENIEDILLLLQKEAPVQGSDENQCKRDKNSIKLVGSGQHALQLHWREGTAAPSCRYPQKYH